MTSEVIYGLSATVVGPTQCICIRNSIPFRKLQISRFSSYVRILTACFLTDICWDIRRRQMLQCDRSVGPRISVVPHFEVFYAMRSAVAPPQLLSTLSWCSRGGEMCSAFYYPSHYLIGRLHLLFHLIFLLLLKCSFFEFCLLVWLIVDLQKLE